MEVHEDVDLLANHRKLNMRCVGQSQMESHEFIVTSLIIVLRDVMSHGAQIFVVGFFSHSRPWSPGAGLMEPCLYASPGPSGSDELYCSTGSCRVKAGPL